ncbi:MAG: hypothetical protein A2W46_00130 [Alphaproteobacteria bacterium RIFCSPHIGHO2_12_42_13]|jgi:hypothetical protein|nr:MAG: hypothetical protein A2Z80_02065 [Alphaproteobacteria bacterium GWA2_41_27]OFW84688.1 MAG: hypothetical protein A3E50_05900 [Alphaproteobacteria bacterium RIFCSPHIGHO2_12_FULL_42_100]OFW86301.1 MAG: hypothetical protein A2W06_04815 [Alphaproteobacteria bacterium RBG_16_42_14]OFW91507.1 MAG: hypothetical protein A2W46_00130 [Alphaproteobacteria bacterium RIFCSPHIGHO2_12_42_13]OFW92800.1 MAG: hypothetical protein A3C41_05700 [Alphaproteobacteria bacterium RIFCSPHIGHO2_02_FULL_42_30]OFX00
MGPSPLSSSFPLKFLMTYDAKTGVETFEREHRWNLKLINIALFDVPGNKNLRVRALPKWY